MNFTLSDAEGFLAEWKNKVLNNPHIKTIICPSFTELFAIADILKTCSSQLGAQNVFYESSGAFTGEISCAMLKEASCQWVIIGHSERRSALGETDEIVHQKLHQLLTEDLLPILCIGETIDERNAGQTKAVLKRQMTIACENLDSALLNKMVIAYEPVWAIGTGVTAHTEIVAEAHGDIRNILSVIGLNEDVISILYGGSVSADNAESLSAIEDLDGFLIGGASLYVEKFYSIYNQL
jgi:triosephosphate isomerase